MRIFKFVPCHKEREWCGIITNSTYPQFPPTSLPAKQWEVVQPQLMHATAAGAQGQPTRWWEEGMVGRGQREQNPQTPSNFRSPLKSGNGPEGPRNSSFMVHLDPPLVRKRKLFNTAFPIQHRKVQQASTGMQHEYQHREDWGSGEFVPCHKER